ncbi:MAG: gluconate 2-dehydrogenase subunit 3 family protein [Acidobacteria bacterium]|nr:gluconate 2-dehydrogenase subunit 3 family protein [Acidobacteriota bacterium]MBI3280921.1 gluconate 2-dehydrogenase subunit 3 family protein [Acidobacteriota bacterium]
MNRRQAVALVALGVMKSRAAVAQSHLDALKKAPGDYKPQCFNPEEYRLIDELAETIIPADDVSGGARAAGVAGYIDLVVANSPAATQQSWRARLAAFDEAARSKQGRPFLALEAAQRAALLNQVARNEKQPRTEAERLFASMKTMTVFGYYSAEIGLRKGLGYRGGQALRSFPGCTHGAGAHT